MIKLWQRNHQNLNPAKQKCRVLNIMSPLSRVVRNNYLNFYRILPIVIYFGSTNWITHKVWIDYLEVSYFCWQVSGGFSEHWQSGHCLFLQTILPSYFMAFFLSYLNVNILLTMLNWLISDVGYKTLNISVLRYCKQKF